MRYYLKLAGALLLCIYAVVTVPADAAVIHTLYNNVECSTFD